VDRAPDSLPVFSALAHATRWAAYEALLRAGADGMPQSGVATALGVDRHLLSAHLKVMREAGLVTAERRGREVTYRALAEAAADAAAAIGRLLEGSSATR
jgi:ArsR family transcriptional regulator